MSARRCSVAHCDREVRARGLCASHLNQVYRGHAVAPFARDLPFSEWLEQRVTREPNSGCWLWLGSVTPKGYALASLRNRSFQVHRRAFEELRGPIGDGSLVIDHLCRVRSCVNPLHMEPVSNRENILRGVASAAVNARKTHCKHGHEFTEENTRTRPDGRECITCKRAAAKRRGHPERRAA